MTPNHPGPTGSAEHGQPTLRSLAASSFLPAMVYEIGTGAVTPVIVTTAIGLGASNGMAAFALSLLGVGRVLGDVPASSIADRLGDRRSMIIAAGVAFFGFSACMVAPSLLVLCLALTVLGATSSTFYLARQSYLIDVAPVRLRARAMSTLAGSHRIGLFIGPFAGALAITIGGTPAAYGVAMVTAIATAVLLLLVADVEAPDDRRARSGDTRGTLTVLLDHRRLFLTLGFVIVGVGAVRQSRQTILPLWGYHIGLDAAQISLVFGMANAVDMVLFYPSGKVMDRWGRLAIALPAMTTIGLAMIALPLTGGMFTLAAVAMIISLGNGIGSGVMQTLGADAAPREGRRRFLGIWRVFGDAGQALGPVVVSFGVVILSLGAGIIALGLVGLAAAGGLAMLVPKYSPFATPRSVLAHRHPPAR